MKVEKSNDALFFYCGLPSRLYYVAGKRAGVIANHRQINKLSTMKPSCSYWTNELKLNSVGSKVLSKLLLS